MNGNTKDRIKFYIMSLWLLFALLLFITIKVPIYFGKNWYFIGTWNLIKMNVLPIISIICLVYGGYSFWKFTDRIKGIKKLPFEVKSVKNINYEHLTFLTTYIIPLVCINLDSNRYKFVLIILIVVIGAIYVKTNLFYANPTLALLGFHIYKITYMCSEKEIEVIVITKKKLFVGDSVRYIDLGDNIYIGG